MKNKFSKRASLALRSVLMLFILIAGFSAGAQIHPASNIRGPLKAKVNSGTITITSLVATDANPAITYTLVNNTSGASIVSQGTFEYDSKRGMGKQIITVNPGTAKGSFTVKLSVTTTGGESCEASKSVTVVE